MDLTSRGDRGPRGRFGRFFTRPRLKGDGGPLQSKVADLAKELQGFKDNGSVVMCHRDAPFFFFCVVQCDKTILCIMIWSDRVQLMNCEHYEHDEDVASGENLTICWLRSVHLTI